MQVIKVRKTLTGNAILQINDYYDQTLEDYLQRTDQPREIIIQQLKDIAAILASMHANNFIHGNINKQTIVLKNNQFHLAHFENFQYPNALNDENYAKEEKKSYIRPPGGQLSFKSDIYQLGVVFFMIYTSEKEFKYELLQKYNINPYTLLIENMTSNIENMTTHIENSFNIRTVFNDLDNIIKGSHDELLFIENLKQFTNHLLAWEFLLDTIHELVFINLFKKDSALNNYLQILINTMVHHRQKGEAYQKKLNSKEYENQFKSQFQNKEKQYQQLLIDKSKKLAKLNILVPTMIQNELQDKQMENQKVYIMQTLQLSNNVHHLHLNETETQDIDQLKLCIRLFFCVDLDNLHINIKERISQYQDIKRLGYSDSIRALEQQLSHYFKKLSDYF